MPKIVPIKKAESTCEQQSKRDCKQARKCQFYNLHDFSIAEKWRKKNAAISLAFREIRFAKWETRRGPRFKGIVFQLSNHLSSIRVPFHRFSSRFIGHELSYFVLYQGVVLGMPSFTALFVIFSRSKI